ncbi:MAG: hypothetical protein ABEH43_09995 [Flavobacteriales bacterium]
MSKTRSKIKDNLIALAIMVVVFAYPFKIAFLEVGKHSNILSLLMFIVFLTGSFTALYFMEK